MRDLLLRIGIPERERAEPREHRVIVVEHLRVRHVLTILPPRRGAGPVDRKVRGFGKPRQRPRDRASASARVSS
ncbi:hypothetical protein GCM10009700_07740 [Brevibacterium sanguinis]